jgi:hypothetical protein
MASTIRQKIVDEIRRRLAAITIANGYETDLGLGPIDEWPIGYQDDELPALGVFDLVNVMVKEYADEKAIINRLPIQVRIFLKREPTPATVRKMLADTQRAVVHDPTTGTRDYTLGGLAVDTLPEEEGFIVPADTFQIDGAAVGFAVQFLSEPFNAFE